MCYERTTWKETKEGQRTSREGLLELISELLGTSNVFDDVGVEVVAETELELGRVVVLLDLERYKKEGKRGKINRRE